MSNPEELEELIAYLTRTGRLSGEEVRRMVAEVLGFLDETPEEFVRRRHRALQVPGGECAGDQQPGIRPRPYLHNPNRKC